MLLNSLSLFIYIATFLNGFDIIVERASYYILDVGIDVYAAKLTDYASELYSRRYIC